MVEPLAWDSEFWDVRAARAHASTEDQLALADQACQELGIEWCSLLVPSTNLPMVNTAVRRGYAVVDVRYAMRVSLGERAPADPNRLAREDETDELASLGGGALRDSRFYIDPHLDDTRCELFYETWVRNSMAGSMADAVLVERVDDQVDGFITVRLHDGRRASLPLVAVHTARHGRGVARRLLAATLDWIAARDVTQVDVVTQLSNVPAIALYNSAGFRLQESAVWLHRWFARP